MKTPKTYEEFCLDFPEETQEILENIKISFKIFFQKVNSVSITEFQLLK